MRQDIPELVMKIMFFVSAVLLGVFLLWLAVGGTTVRSEARLDIRKMWNGEHYELQPAVGYRYYQVTAQIQTDEQTAINPQGFTAGLGWNNPISKDYLQSTMHGKALQSQGEAAPVNYTIVQ